MSAFNAKALRWYSKAHGKNAETFVRKGIMCFETPEEALADAEEAIQRYTKSDFTMAHFYEYVKRQALLRIELRSSKATE